MNYDFNTAQKIILFIKDFFSKYDEGWGDQIRSLLQIWSHLLKKSLMENFILCSIYPGTSVGLVLQPLCHDLQERTWENGVPFSCNLVLTLKNTLWTKENHPLKQIYCNFWSSWIIVTRFCLPILLSVLGRLWTFHGNRWNIQKLPSL